MSFSVANHTDKKSFSYPFAYSLVVLPTSIARWLKFSGHHVSSAAQFFGASMFNLSGAVNVVLFLVSGSQLLLFAPPGVVEPNSPEPDQGPQLAAVDHADDFRLRELPSRQTPEGSRNTAVNPGDGSTPGLEEII
jgi:hypothetical protein